MSASSSWYECPQDFTQSYCSDKYMKGFDYESWERKQKERIENEKAKDPKTVFGWAMKSFICK